MLQILNAIRESNGAYSDLGINLALLWVGIIYLYIREENRQRRSFMYVVLDLMFLLLNPFTAGNGNYYRMVAIIPTVTLLAYVMAKTMVKESKKTNRVILVAGFLVILLISLNFRFTTGNIGVIENKYKVSDEAQELQQIVSELGDVYVIAPREIGEQLREYDVSFRILGGDEEKWGVINDISQNWSDSEKIKNYADIYDAKCIVCPKDEDGSQGLDPESFSLIAQTENYWVYVLNEEEK
ncbi:MAG: hypothetical protein MR355_10920 [Lachnospiraceae bacterium]|nr:hypothetical protein [Lachnospiraceae bacterium]